MSSAKWIFALKLGKAVLLVSISHVESGVLGLIYSKNSSPGFGRLECLHACLIIPRAVMENIFNVPIADYVGFSFSFFTQLARYLVAVYRLSVLIDLIWDPGSSPVNHRSLAGGRSVDHQHAAGEGVKGLEHYRGIS